MGYVVNHNKQQPDGSYTVADTERFFAAEGATVTAAAKNYTADGHYTLNTEKSTTNGTVVKPSVTDGKLNILTLELYYDLDEHIVNFNADNGTGLTTADVKCGGTVAAPADPTKDGFKFQGWYNGDEKFDFGTKITEDITLTAKWDKTTEPVTPVAAAYQVETYVEQADGTFLLTGTDTKSGKLNETVTVDTTTAPEHHVFDAENEGNVISGPVTKPELVDGKLTNLLVLKAYYKLDSHTVTFNADNGTEATTATVKHGEKAAEPTAPTKAGYRFDGWYYDSALKKEVTDDVKVNSSTVTLYAGWTASTVPAGLNGEDHFAYIQGYADGTVRPNTPVTRAQVATMINRVLCRMPEENADLLKGMTSFTDCAEGDWCYLAIQEATNSHDYKAKSGSIYEAWTDLNTAPDWSKFEH